MKSDMTDVLIKRRKQDRDMEGRPFEGTWRYLGFPGGSDGKESACNAGDLVQSLSWEYPLQKGTATYSSILTWRIPWTEESGRLQSMGLQRVRHNFHFYQFHW